MEKLILAGGCALVALLAAAKLIQLLQWTRREAVVVRLPDRSVADIVYAGRIPVAFRLADGREQQGVLRRFGRSAPPTPGSRVRIIHDPAEPGQVEWAWAPLVVALILAALGAASLRLLWIWW